MPDYSGFRNGFDPRFADHEGDLAHTEIQPLIHGTLYQGDEFLTIDEALAFGFTMEEIQEQLNDPMIEPGDPLF